MAFTREFIRKAAKESGVDLQKEFEDALMQEHLSARDFFANEKVKAALDENKPEPAPAAKDTPEYKALKKQFDDYKADITAKESKAAKTAAARAYYESKGITGKALEIAVRGSTEEISALELEGGKIKGDAALEALVKGDLACLVTTVSTEGAAVAHPPANSAQEAKSAPNARAAQIAAQYHNNLYGATKKE